MKTTMVIEGEKGEDTQALVFFLSEGLNGGVALRVRDANDSEDEGWWVAEVTQEGTLKRYSYLPRQDFFQTEEGDTEYGPTGHIVMEDE